MRFLPTVLIFFMGTVASAASQLNHITCEYVNNGSAWEFYAVNYNSNNFSLERGESRMVVGAWTSTRKVNTGYCISMIGTEKEDVVENVLTVYRATNFENFDMENCEAKGEDVQIVQRISKKMKHGDLVQFTVDDWYDQDPKPLLLKHYLPTVSELDLIMELAPKKCESLIL